MLNLNLNIVGAGGRSNIGAGPDVGPTTTTTTTVPPTTTTTTTTLAPASFRNDPYSASLLFATPGNDFTTLGMSSSYSDVHANVAGIALSNNFAVNTGSFADASYTNFAANGYVTSTRVESTGSFYNQNNSAFHFTTEDITFETWIYGLGDGSSKTFYSDYTPGDVNNSSIWVHLQNTNQLRWVFEASTAPAPPGEYVLQTGGLTWDANQWYHIAFVKNGTTYTIYRDGVNYAQVTAPNNINSTNQPKRIMGYRNVSEQSVWVQDYKIYKGAAVYTSSFTPPPSMVI